MNDYQQPKLTKKTRHFVATTFAWTGVTKMVRATNRCFQPQRALILMYHRLRESSSHQTEFSLSVVGPSARLFDSHMRYLKQNYNVISFNRLVQFLQKEATIPPNSVVITFDDGYKDTYTLAYPILKKYDLPATVFLATGFVGTDRLLWYDKVAYLLHRTSRETIALNGADYSLSTPSERREAAKRLTARLKQLNEVEKSGLIKKLQRACGVEIDGRSFKLALSWDDVREMARNGISFGAHTVTHPILARVSKETARMELLESKSTIENELQAPVHLFAYPNGELGDFNEETQTLVKECGYEAACTSVYGPNSSTSDIFTLRRLWIGPNDSLPIFSAKLAGVFPLRSRLKRTFNRGVELSK